MAETSADLRELTGWEDWTVAQRLYRLQKFLIRGGTIWKNSSSSKRISSRDGTPRRSSSSKKWKRCAKHAERRTTRSWEYSIWNASRQIQRVNKRRKSGGVYLSELEMREVIAEAYPDALKRAALEAFEGQHTETQLEAMIDREQLHHDAFAMVMSPAAS